MSSQKRKFKILSTQSGRATVVAEVQSTLLHMPRFPKEWCNIYCLFFVNVKQEGSVLNEQNIDDDDVKAMDDKRKEKR